MQSTEVIDPILPVHVAELVMTFSGTSAKYYVQKQKTILTLVNNN